MPKIELLQGWYRTGLDLFPIMRINKIRQLIPPSDEAAEQDERFDEDPLVEFDLFAPGDGAPIPMLATQREVQRYGLKPAKREDFEELELEHLLDISTLGPIPKVPS